MTKTETNNVTLAKLFDAESGTWVLVRPFHGDPTRYVVRSSNCGLKRGLRVQAETPVHLNDAASPAGPECDRTNVRPQDLRVIYDGVPTLLEHYCRMRYYARVLHEGGQAALDAVIPDPSRPRRPLAPAA